MKRINLWASPRNISKAIMYSFEQRPKISVIDEPFYAFYLNKTGLDHPGKEQIIKSQATEYHVVGSGVMYGNYNTPYGFVSETNVTNVFMINIGSVHTPFAHACLPGVTRGKVIELTMENNIPRIERNISVSELYNAAEVFTTGSRGELTNVLSIDRRKIENKLEGFLLKKLQAYYGNQTASKGEVLPF